MEPAQREWEHGHSPAWADLSTHVTSRPHEVGERHVNVLVAVASNDGATAWPWPDAVGA
jgi:hypothetical protein